MHIRFVNKLVNSLRSRKLVPIEFQYNKLTLNLLKLLDNKNLIDYKILIHDEKKIKIEINSIKFKNLKAISKPGLVKNASYEQLKIISFDCILSTNKGLMTKEEAIEAKTGGQLLFKILF